MAVQLPPFPANAPPGGFVWTDWWKKFQDYVQDITDVAGQGSENNFFVNGITGSTTTQIQWTVVANQVHWEIRIDLDTTPVVAVNSYIPINQIGVFLMPTPLYDATFTLAAFRPPNEVYSIGVGIAHGTDLYLPNFTLPTDISGNNSWEWIAITGTYFVS